MHLRNTRLGLDKEIDDTRNGFHLFTDFFRLATQRNHIRTE